jgi:hypothetical protein
MTVVEQLANDSGTDQPATAGNEYLHEMLLNVMGLLSHHRNTRWDKGPIA